MNINSILVEFAQEELVLSKDEKERIRIVASLEQLEKKLNDYFGFRIKELLRFGSFTRNTILPRKYDPLSDIDLMVVFNTNNGILTPGTYRRQLLDMVNMTYPNSLAGKDHPVVKLELNHIMFDVIPAYTEESFAFSKRYLIPGRGDAWTITVPNDINEMLKKRNTNEGDNTIRNIIRLCKYWNANSNYPLESYKMEKNILSIPFYNNENTYMGFLKVMSNISADNRGVQQALEYIRQYQGNWQTPANEIKQLEWLQKLLPGLK